MGGSKKEEEKKRTREKIIIATFTYLCGWTNTNGYFYLHSPTRTWLHEVVGSYDLHFGMSNQSTMDDGIHRAALENSAEESLKKGQCETSPGLRCASGQLERKSESWIWVVKNSWSGYWLPFSVWVNTKCQTRPFWILWGRYKPRHTGGNKTILTALCCLSFGVLLACERNSKHISVYHQQKTEISTEMGINDSAQQACCTTWRVLQALYCKKSDQQLDTSGPNCISGASCENCSGFWL